MGGASRKSPTTTGALATSKQVTQAYAHRRQGPHRLGRGLPRRALGHPDVPCTAAKKRTATASPGLQTAPGTACGRKSNAPPRCRTGPTARASCSISGRRRCARRRGANGSSREKRKGPARPPEGDSCGSPRAESSPGGPRALGKKVAPTFFLASFLSLKRDPSFVARDHSTFHADVHHDTADRAVDQRSRKATGRTSPP